MLRLSYFLPVLAAVLLGAALTGCAQSDAPKPSQTSAKAMSSQEKEARAVAACLTDEGWTVTYDPRDNSISSSTSESQGDKYEAAYKKCDLPYRKNQEQLSDLTDTQWQSLYAQEKSAAVCLRKLGVNIPDIPAYQTFVDRYQSDSPWMSYGFIGAPEQDKYYEYVAKCPQPTV